MMRHSSIRTAIAVIFSVGALVPPVLQAQGPARVPTNTLRFANAHLEDVIVAMGQMLGITVVATDVPDKRVTLNTATPVRNSELGSILESLLESHGLVMVRNGSVAQVVPSGQTPAGSQLGVGFEMPEPVPVA